MPHVKEFMATRRAKLSLKGHSGDPPIGHLASRTAIVRFRVSFQTVLLRPSITLWDVLRRNNSWLCHTFIRTTKPHKQLLAIVAAFVFLQLYCVRELVAAEFLFGAGLAVFLVLAVSLYLIGAIGERSLEWSEEGVKMLAHLMHRKNCSFHVRRSSPIWGRPWMSAFTKKTPSSSKVMRFALAISIIPVGQRFANSLRMN
jgi:hypothetical protein